MGGVAWMVSASAVCGLVAFAATGGRFGPEILSGMLGPLAATCGSWLLAEGVFKRDPERLTSVMAAGFFAKLVFFGAYVVAALRGFSLAAVPFVVSFTGYFIGLYAIEAVFLWRLLSAPSVGARP